jgi:hypothetical protein
MGPGRRILDGHTRRTGNDDRAQNAGADRPGQSWQRVQFPDGSGSIALPPGWRLTSARQAAAEMQGPRAEAVAVGSTMPVIARRGGYSAQTRIVEVAPTPPLTQNGRTAYLLADQMNHGRPYRSFALVNSAALGNGYWQYYMTLLTAPAEVFPQALPQMTEIWQPWSISQGEMNRRTAQAMLTMQETNRIMQSTSEGRRTTEWHQHLTGMTLQGYSLFERFPGRYRVVRASDLK